MTSGAVREGGAFHFSKGESTMKSENGNDQPRLSERQASHTSECPNA
jgi:hypothetical protein